LVDSSARTIRDAKGNGKGKTWDAGFLKYRALLLLRTLLDRIVDFVQSSIPFFFFFFFFSLFTGQECLSVVVLNCEATYVILFSFLFFFFFFGDKNSSDITF